MITNKSKEFNAIKIVGKFRDDNGSVQSSRDAFWERIRREQPRVIGDLNSEEIEDGLTKFFGLHLKNELLWNIRPIGLDRFFMFEVEDIKSNSSIVIFINVINFEVIFKYFNQDFEIFELMIESSVPYALVNSINAISGHSTPVLDLNWEASIPVKIRDLYSELDGESEPNKSMDRIHNLPKYWIFSKILIFIPVILSLFALYFIHKDISYRSKFIHENMINLMELHNNRNESVDELLQTYLELQIRANESKDENILDGLNYSCCNLICTTINSCCPSSSSVDSPHLNSCCK